MNGFASALRLRLVWGAAALWLGLAALLSAPHVRAAEGCGSWPAWEQFRRDFLSDDGRVIDTSEEDRRTVSEGQSYALFFALVANDRYAFDAIMHWTENNLADGDLTARLPAWLWGHASDGSWKVLDSNSASDADLWIAYALLEAGALWGERTYTLRGARLAARVLQDETFPVAGVGRFLMPGTTGFHPAEDAWIVNPSYAPLQVLRSLATRFATERRWQQLVDGSAVMLRDSAPRGLAPDWATYTAGRAFDRDPGSTDNTTGSYNAIRVYLWAGMLDPDDPHGDELRRHFVPFADLIAARGAPPETVDAASGTAASNDGNAGFSAAAVPFLVSLGQGALASGQAARVERLNAQRPPGYYTSVLSLFGIGWYEGRYRFAADGALRPAWSATCTPR
ncbi:cellulose synthase complex periplasmic endoglucanase BcsZ [Caballeronia sp. LZ062]|uniref:cellulose synthase complex periplasmic endoglucanase BcsZ n=1 Tax=unclassified Caballeronia TaxID=2646786 RepID=UPI002865526E|nr:MULTISPECIES: cellulose synthase complex periplasmic endoglucanase BcsZ [unclassified Caballeronia]MDR5856206.1 cellulose synthase complex periplasmic endoglucanase BcsZ [Caballeronia sp. LZ050]MDR5872877.1 cellulose synthase complex periplasmic endoglucanase BcsZ [Caballeronia sp. LZ062]